MARWRIAFMGTPDFGVTQLKALSAQEIVAVYTQPPRPAGRGKKKRPSPVQLYAESCGLPVRHPKSLKDPGTQQDFADLALDLAVVAAYGLILPKAVLTAPRYGCLNVHASRLPRWRGAAPIQRAILAGDRESGVTIMQMDEGLDSGAIVSQESYPITAVTTAQDLHDGLAALGAKLIAEALTRLGTPEFTRRPQPETGVTYAQKVTRAEGRLDWGESAQDLDRRIRAFTPWPGAWFEWSGERIKVLQAEVASGAGPAGAVLDTRLTVACGAGALRLLRVQRAGKGEMVAEEFLRGATIGKGSRLA
jgi:methionyl-tRNA formyltransferase